MTAPRRVLVESRVIERLKQSCVIVFDWRAADCQRCGGQFVTCGDNWDDPICINCGEFSYRTSPPVDVDMDIEWASDEAEVYVKMDMVLGYLIDRGPSGITAVAQSLAMNYDDISQVMWRLKADGRVQRERVIGRNAYLWEIL